MQTLPMDANLAGGGSPKALFQLFYYNIANHYFETLRSTQDSGNIEAATASIIALCCPDKEMREKLWQRYTDITSGKEKGTEIGGSSVITASVLVIGDLTSYLNDVLEFTEKSTAAFM